MRNPSGVRRFRPWSGAVLLGTGIALVLAGSPASAGSGVVKLEVSLKSAAGVITCPSVADRLSNIPASARAEVDRELAALDKQIDEANERLASSAGEGGADSVQNSILGPLADKRTAAIDRIAQAIVREGGTRPSGLEEFATCTMTGDPNSSPRSASASPSPSKSASPSKSPSKSPSPSKSSSPSASPSKSSAPPANGGAQAINCPSVADRLPEVPAAAQEEVDRNLEALEEQIEEAESNLAITVGDGGDDFVQENILDPLSDERAVTINRIERAIDRAGDRTAALDDLATCTLVNAGGAADAATADDYVKIEDVKVTERPRAGEDASAGTFISDCGTNEEGHTNSDNVITAPGVANGAEAEYDYVGNTATNATSTNESLSDASTTCKNKGDRSTYFWPALRLLDQTTTTTTTTTTQDAPADSSGSTTDHGAHGGTPEESATTDSTTGGSTATGKAVRPSSVRLEYRGNPQADVTAAPRFLRLLSGDARAATNGGANARPTWSCTGFTDRLTDKYPICPSNSDLVRVFDMPSCWDGENTDSANHRAHLVFPDDNGACPSGTKPVPQLRMTLTYDDVPAPEGTDDMPFVVDAFASEGNNPDTDHAGSITVMSDQLMKRIVTCINTDKKC